MSNVNEMNGSFYETLENIVEKGENDGYQHFLILLHFCFFFFFQKACFSGSLKLGHYLNTGLTPRRYDLPWE